MNRSYIKKVRPIAEMLLCLTTAVFLFAGCGGNDLEKNLAAADNYSANMDYGNAIAIYNRIINENENCTEAYIGLAKAYSKKNNMKKSLEVLTRGLDLADDTQAIEEYITVLFPDYFEDPLGYTVSNELSEDTETVTEDTETETAVTTAPENPASEETTETASDELSETEEEETEETTTAEEIQTTTTASVITTTTTTAFTTTAAPVTTSLPVTTTPRTTTAPPVTTTAPRTSTAPPRTTTAPRTTAPRTTPPPQTTTTAKVHVSVKVDDFTGMDKEEVRTWCRENGVRLFSSGSGKVVSQSPPPGSDTDEDTEIIIICE